MMKRLGIIQALYFFAFLAIAGCSEAADSVKKFELSSLEGSTDALSICVYQYSSKWSITDNFELTELSCDREANESMPVIDTVDGISKYPNIKTLTLRNHNISDVSFLKNLNKLKWLDIRSNKVTDVSEIANLTKLQMLDVSYNKISNEKSLAKLERLQNFICEGCGLQNIEFLSDTSSLFEINIWGNQLQDLGNLKKLERLQHVNVGSNPIRNLEALSDLTGLYELGLENTPNLDCEQVKKIKNNNSELAVRGKKCN